MLNTRKFATMKRTHHLLARQDSKWTSQYKKPCWSSQKTSVVWSAKSDVPHLMWEISDCAREGPEKVLSWPMVETPWLCMTKQIIKSVLLKTRINGALLSHGVSWFLKKKILHFGGHKWVLHMDLPVKNCYKSSPVHWDVPCFFPISQISWSGG